MLQAAFIETKEHGQGFLLVDHSPTSRCCCALNSALYLPYVWISLMPPSDMGHDVPFYYGA